ncbi:nectin-2-like isoform X1 [Solea senegalensis]|uniref:Nectin-2-like isoform X1 n=1 Tax=Solea senegalensis TaxID=28829 RepID=A0AAV6RFN1_SOLSE|nr:nectin-3-like protein [Solea senegalensis]XP_043873446.1 nectin-3-like protein [Solea senegalensis]KAG7503965.1 nectin-2-like isoform X1 [Solea senegalensis]
METYPVYVSHGSTCGFPPASSFPMRCTRILTLTLVFLFLDKYGHAVQVIGGNRTAVQGGTIVLHSNIIDTTETLGQVSWMRATRGEPLNNNFYTVVSDNGGVVDNGHKDGRFKFIGNLKEKNGSLRLSNVTLLDEGVYTCIFTLFPSGNHKTEIPLKVLVPPVTEVKDDLPVLGDKEISLATCLAAGSRPPAEVRWLTGTLTQKLRSTTDYIQHENGTTTTVSYLIGEPTREIYQHVVHCVITSPALSKEETIPFTLQIYFSPREVTINTMSKDSFQCVTEANPSAKITWSRPGQPWPQSAVDVHGATLQFSNMNSDLNGLYQCEVSNLHGRDRAYVFVHVTSGTCCACWTLFGILFFLNVTAAVVCCLLKYGILQRIIEGIRERLQNVPPSSSGPAETGSLGEEPELQPMRSD